MICLNWYDWNVNSLMNVSEEYKSRDWSAWIDTIETSLFWALLLVCLIPVGIDLPELIRLKPLRNAHFQDFRLAVGIDLPELIRLKPFKLVIVLIRHLRRDWSAWIDTIETMLPRFANRDPDCRRDWSAWIDTIETLVSDDVFGWLISRSGLICMNWYDWNLYLALLGMKVSSVVGIDLHELIRLKPRFSKTQLLNIFSRDWSAWIDTIETFSYGWFWCYLHQVGIDLHELIRLKPLFILNSYIVEHIYVGIDLHELIRLKHLLFSNFIY